jgi:hypothetical protein
VNASSWSRRHGHDDLHNYLRVDYRRASLLIRYRKHGVLIVDDEDCEDLCRLRLARVRTDAIMVPWQFRPVSPVRYVFSGPS